MACAATMRLRMYWALGGTSSASAFSTARTDVIACTVVHTPQNRWVDSQASRGSRPTRIRSMPRNIWPDDHALVTTPLSTSTSMRRCPSIRVTGSIVMLLDMYRLSLAAAGKNGERLHDDDVRDEFRRDKADRD